MNGLNDTFFNVPVKKVNTAGGEIDLPIFYYDYGYAHFLFWADYERVFPKLEGTFFTPCKFFNGRAGVLLNFFEYRDSAIGPYNEVGLSILCHPRSLKRPGPFLTQLMKDAKKWTMGAYVIDLPVTTEIAHAGGREIWSYPKFVTGIVSDLRGKHFRGVVDDPDLGEPMVSLEGRMGLLGPGIRLSKASFISHTTHKGRPLRTLTDVDARFKVNLGFSGRLRVNEKSHHVMAKNIVDMGLKDRKPFLVLHCEKARMILHGGVEME
ncbi:MAG: acetoacetate decarboxylase family protein [Spirochaetes bacterium]|nr:acetoacetate decarboxylase family protein [Spirochaetota bacterium]